MYEWEKRPTDFILGIILHLQTVIQINIIYFFLGKGDTAAVHSTHSYGFWSNKNLAKSSEHVKNPGGLLNPYMNFHSDWT